MAASSHPPIEPRAPKPAARTDRKDTEKKEREAHHSHPEQDTSELPEPGGVSVEKKLEHDINAVRDSGGVPRPIGASGKKRPGKP